MRRIGAARWPELRGPLVVVLPVGSLEQHGPHLPLDTDTRVAVAVADAALALLEADEGRDATVQPTPCGKGRPAEVWTAPPLAYGASGEHAGFAGTLSMGNAALQHVIVELARSAGPEVAAIVVVNGHGGNSEALARAAQVCRHEGRPLSVWSPQLDHGDAHAGRTETSLLLAIAPDAVRLELAAAGDTRPLGAILDELRRGGVAAVSPNGVLGDPSGASAEEGRALLAVLARQCADAISIAAAAATSGC